MRSAARITHTPSGPLYLVFVCVRQCDQVHLKGASFIYGTNEIRCGELIRRGKSKTKQKRKQQKTVCSGACTL